MISRESGVHPLLAAALQIDRIDIGLNRCSPPFPPLLLSRHLPLLPPNLILLFIIIIMRIPISTGSGVRAQEKAQLQLQLPPPTPTLDGDAPAS